MPVGNVKYNLNTSRKPETHLEGNLIHENINIYGIQCLWLFSERINEDELVFRDFSHFKVLNKGNYKEVTLLPEDSSSWEGDVAYNGFGIYQQYTQHLFISKKDMLRLYPDFLTQTGSRSKIVNSLLITPSSTILEVTHVESFDVGVSNLWAYNDNPNSYKLTVKVFANNLADEGTTEIKDTIKLEEGPDGEIFDYDEKVDTSDIDDFFSTLDATKNKQNTEGDKKSSSGGPFGSLG